MKQLILSLLVLCFLAPQGPGALAAEEKLSKEDMREMLAQSEDPDSAESVELLNARDRGERERRRAEEERRRRERERQERRREEEDRQRRDREQRREQERRERQREEERRQRERERDRQRERERERQRERERERQRERERERNRERERERRERDRARERERERQRERERERRERERRERERDRWNDDDYQRPTPRPPRDNDGYYPPTPPPTDDDGYTPPPPPRGRFPADAPTCDDIEETGLCTILRLSYERPHLTYNLDKGHEKDTEKLQTLTFKSAANDHASPGMILGIRMAYVQFANGYRQDLVVDGKALYPQNISPKGNLFLGQIDELVIPLEDQGKIARVYVHADSWIGAGIDAFMAVILE